jgi:TctA family transporter
MEESFRQSMIISDGDFSIFVTRPISALLLLSTAMLMAIILMPNIGKRRKEVFAEED